MNLPLPVLQAYPKCALCDLGGEAKNRGIPTIYDTRSLTLGSDPVVVIVGMNPGHEEDKVGEPFVGRSGRILRGRVRPDGTVAPGPYVDGIRLRESASVFYANAARCHSPAGNPTLRHMRECSPYLQEDLRQIRRAVPRSTPLYLLLLGGDAVNAVNRYTLGRGKRSLREALAAQGEVVEFDGVDWHLFATYHPAYILRSPAKIHAVEDHLALLADHLSFGSLAKRTVPDIIPVRDPRPDDPRVLSLDIETYGFFRWSYVDRDRFRLPKQTVFHPQRSIETDKCPRKHLVQTVAITFPQSVASNCSATSAPNAKSTAQRSCSDTVCVDGLMSPSDRWTPLALAALRPGQTIVFQMHLSTHRKALIRWLTHATTLIGMNLPFDIQYLRCAGYHMPLSDARLTLIDLAVVNYLHNPDREERSLKTIGLILGTHSYEQEHKGGTNKYHSSKDPRAIRYNAEDTHNTLLAVGTLARRTQEDYGASDKLTPECIRHYSDTLWGCIRMGEAGVPVTRRLLQRVERDVLGRLDAGRSRGDSFGLILDGPGSASSKREFIERLIEAMPEGTDLSSLELTKRKREVSVCDQNRVLLGRHLPDNHPLRPVLETFNEYSKCQKLLSSYLYPLLHHRRTDPSDEASVVLGADRSYPSWYPVPSYVKEGGGGMGGTEQGRITCKRPAVQTFPKPIKMCVWRDGRVFVWVDFSQLELRVFALLSGEPVLIQNYKDDGDLHCQTAITVAAANSVDFTALDPESYEYNLWRQGGKMVNFARLFRSTAGTMQTQFRHITGVSLPIGVFKEIEEALATDWPVGYDWQERMIVDAKANHNIVLPFTGQHRNFSGCERLVDENYINTIVNFPIQTFAGNTCIQFQKHLSKYLPGINMKSKWAEQHVNIYDAVGISCEPGRVPELREIIAVALEELTSPTGYLGKLMDRYGHHLPFRVDIDVIDKEPDPCKQLQKMLAPH